MTSVLQLQGLTKSYRLGSRFRPSSVPALRGVDLDVHAGEIVGLLGPNGAGKSTLLLCIAGLLQQDAGTVAWFGETLARNAAPRGVAYSPERAAYYPFLTVRETLDYFGSLHDLPLAARRSRVGEVIEQVQLEPHVNKRVTQLSRGMIQRLGIAQALVGAPRALLLDETLSGLDPVANRDMRLLLGELSKAGIVIVLSSHDMAALEVVATRIVILTGGRVSSDFPTSELTSRGLLEQRFFEAIDATATVSSRAAS